MEELNKITVTDIEDILLVFSPKGIKNTILNRKCYGLSFCIDGQITYTQNGNKYVSDKNHAIILPQNQTYTIYGDKTGLFPVINFRCSDFLCDKITAIPIINSDWHIKNFEQMKNLYLFERNRTKVISIFYDIIYKIYSDNLKTSKILLPAIDYLENNYHNAKLSNAILAKQCGISEIYFRKIFTEQFKTSPKQFMTDIRINKAKQLLSEGILKIHIIAEECGFSNPYHFSHFFKQKTGLSPTEYMKQNKIYKI